MSIHLFEKHATSTLCYTVKYGLFERHKSLLQKLSSDRLAVDLSNNIQYVSTKPSILFNNLFVSLNNTNFLCVASRITGEEKSRPKFTLLVSSIPRSRSRSSVARRRYTQWSRVCVGFQYRAVLRPVSSWNKRE